MDDDRGVAAARAAVGVAGAGVDPQRHAQVKRVFREALRWPPADRAAVATALAVDEAVRDEALSLLAHHRDEPALE